MVTIVCMGLTPPSFAAGGGGGGGGLDAAGASPVKKRAITSYKKGDRLLKRGIKHLQEAAATSDTEEEAEALASAQKQFERALREFAKATRRDKKFHQAYNQVGFTQRLLGNYDEALEAYDKALAIEPDFPHAVEYRGEAYMKLGRLEDAKAAYMELFADERKLADLLMKKMKAWLVIQQKKPGGVPTEKLQSFSTWVDERSEIAGQTAALVDGVAPRTW
jgi:tetratricopeptide (TPR) repeat protein